MEGGRGGCGWLLPSDILELPSFLQGWMSKNEVEVEYDYELLFEILQVTGDKWQMYGW